jgi:hypothetical protein
MNNSIDDSLISNELTNITSELTEVGLDSFLQDGILKDIPFIGTLVGLTKIGVGIQDKLFLKKILRFLHQLKDIPSETRQEFIEKIDTDKKFKTKVSETIMLLVDKINDYSKADYLGKLFAASINGKISYDIFLKLANIVDKSHIPDLDHLIPIYRGQIKEVDEINGDILYNLGLLTNLGISGETIMYLEDEKVSNKKNELEINNYGKLIVELILLTDNGVS